MCTERYVDPFTDFGFKLLFGTPANKEFLIQILNALLMGREVITDISYNNSELFGKSADDRKAVFDLYCTTTDGSHIIVECQNAYQRYFMDRTVYYSSFPMQAIARKGDWDYKLPRIYTIAFLNFTMPAFADSADYMHTVQLCDVDTREVFFDKLTYIYLELPKFNKEINDLSGYADAWLYVIRNLVQLEEKPSALREKVFERFFRVAEIARFSPEERAAYEASLKQMRDYRNTIISAEEKGYDRGIEEGREEGRMEGIAQGREEGIAQGREEGSTEKALEIARNLLRTGISPKDIAAATGLSEETILSIV